MKWAKSLQRRIVAVYLTLAACASIFFFALAAIAVEGIELYLVDDRLESVATWASPRHAAGLPVEMPTGLSFYHGDAIPQFLRGLPQGVYEIDIDGNELHVLTGRDADGTYVVVDRTSEYDKIELVVYSMIGVGLLGFLLLSFFTGRYVARRIVAPIILLAEAVSDKNSRAELPLLANEDEMGDLARAFAARTEELKRFLDRERFFTGDVSHELRTPLTVIIGAAEIIEADTGGQPVLHAAAERILRTATEAAECITVLLLLARAPQLIDAPENLISQVVLNEVEHSRPLIGNKPVSLDCMVEVDFSVFARRELLAAAIGNLIRNACQYTLEGSVLVRVNRAVVTVEDTGPGLPDFVRARLLGQPPLAEQTGSAGSGLGLALAARICEYLGASLQVELRPEGGTRFSIEFLTKS
ncbi:MAG: HAMP domain-containing sensor histidine kinase [Burkholderiaceae bacterium]|nr:HAMP domain-containing sensor histidine kinase [Burkholderiaceae bacterium]